MGEAHVIATQESVVLVVQAEGDDDLPNTARVKRHGQRGERRHGQRVGTVEAEGWSDDVDSKVDVRVRDGGVVVTDACNAQSSRGEGRL